MAAVAFQPPGMARTDVHTGTASGLNLTPCKSRRLALAPGTRLGVYQVTTPLGEGGMGQVYRATDTKLKRQVAIKILPPSLADDQDRLVRFQREAEVLASLNHPNIAGIYGFEDSGGVAAFVMELVEGPTLADRIAKGPEVQHPHRAVGADLDVRGGAPRRFCCPTLALSRSAFMLASESAVGSSARLGADLLEPPRLGPAQRGENVAAGWEQVLNPVRPRHHQHHTEGQHRQILLVCQLSVHGDERVDAGTRPRQEFTVLHAGPTHTLNGQDHDRQHARAAVRCTASQAVPMAAQDKKPIAASATQPGWRPRLATSTSSEPARKLPADAPSTVLDGTVAPGCRANCQSRPASAHPRIEARCQVAQRIRTCRLCSGGAASVGTSEDVRR